LNDAHRQRGMTAVEVLASTILSALLMTALIGVLRGLKAHEQTLQSRRPTPPWQTSLEAALAADLQQASTYQLTPGMLLLTGHGGRSETGMPNWLPSRVVYEIRRTDGLDALIRREESVAGGGPSAADNIALLGASEVRIALATPTDAPTSPLDPSATGPAYQSSVTTDTPVPAQLMIEFWSTSGESIFRYRHRRL
jgi:hypothetical protein